MSYRCYLFTCLYLIFLLSSISQGATIGYIPTPACATSLGCNFNSPIWNVSGSPSPGDDVYITSDVQITIVVNYSHVFLHSLTFGYGNSSRITFILYNSVLNLTSQEIALHYYNSLLQISNSTLATSGSIYGNDLVATSGIVDVSTFSLTGNISIDSSECSGANWNFHFATLFGSSFDIKLFDADKIYAYGASFTVRNLLVRGTTSQINNGYLNVGQAIRIENCKLQFLNTLAYIPEVIASNSVLSFSANDGLSTLTLGGMVNYFQNCNENNFSVILDDGVTANILFGIICSLVLGDQVTLRFDSDYNFTEVFEIQQTSNASPANIIIDENYLSLHTFQPLFAEISTITEYSALLVRSNLAIVGSITGKGKIGLYNANLSASYINIREVYGGIETGVITTKNFMNTNLIWCERNSKLIIHSPETYIYPPGIIIGENPLFFNGKYIQDDGAVFFSNITNLSPLIVVNGSVSLTNVSFSSPIPPNSINSTLKIILFRSLTKQISTRNISFSNSDDGVSVLSLRFSESDGELFVEAYQKGKSNQNVFTQNYVYLGFVVGFVLLIVVFIILVWLKKRKKEMVQYLRIN